MLDADGKDLGTALLTETAHGVLITADLTGLAPGVHGFHIHTTGKCEAPFTSAGGHFNPGNVMHGFGAKGTHAGDMPNIHIAADGTGEVEILDSLVTLSPGANSLIDKDGSALVIHASADDYMTDPSGNSGARIACGVILLDKR